MKRIVVLNILVLFLFFNVSVFSQREDIEGDTQTEMNINSLKMFERFDSIRNVLIKEIIIKKEKDTSFVKRFKNAQEIWRNWRDSEIEAFYPDYPDDEGMRGSMFPMCYNSKLIDWTEERIKNLKIYLDKISLEETNYCFSFSHSENIKNYEDKDLAREDSIMMFVCDEIIHFNAGDTLFIKNFKKTQDVWFKWRDCEIEAFYPDYINNKEFYELNKQLECCFNMLVYMTYTRIMHLNIYLNVNKNDACSYGRN